VHIYPPFTPPQFWRFGLFRINRQGKRRRNIFLDFLPKNEIILIYKLVIQIGLEADFPSRSEEIRIQKVLNMIVADRVYCTAVRL
jgi:hypothetical protein